MNYHIDIQHACEETIPISDETLSNWAQLTLKEHRKVAELTLRFVDLNEITYLNHTYRNQDKPTNVLAFPSNIPDNIELEFPLLGDVIICPSVLQTESLDLNKPLTAHWAHIVIHGILHLLGYDHIEEAEAATMQKLEIELLMQLGFNNPYDTEDNHIE